MEPAGIIHCRTSLFPADVPAQTKPEIQHTDRLKALTAASLQEFANDLKMTGLAKSHISKILSVSRAALDYAVEPLHYLAANPMQYVK